MGTRPAPPEPVKRADHSSLSISGLLKALRPPPPGKGL